MNLIKPEKLKKGDTIAFLALSGSIENKENIFRAKEYFEKKGYKVILSENIFDKKRYLAGEDETKIQELHKFIQNPDIKMILIARGGYGIIRLLDKIDFELIKNNPKIIAGYSDVTALEAMIYKKTGLITFYAPHALNDFGIEEISKITENSFFETITNSIELTINAEPEAKVYYEGDTTATLWGGNLATLASLCGQDFIPNEKFILFIEDLNEPVYKIDKMMTQLLNIEKFKQNISGLILGDFLDSGNEDDLNDLFNEIANNLKVPTISGFRVTHAKDKITIPYGASATLSTDKKSILVENYMKD